MKKRIILGAALVLVAAFVNSSPTGNAAPAFITYEDYSIPFVQGQVPPTQIYLMVSTFPGVTVGDQLQSCIGALPPVGGTCDATGVTTPLTIDSGTNIFANSKGPGKLILGPGTFTVYAQQVIPSQWEIAGSAQQTTTLKNAFNNPFPSPTFGMLTNSAALTFVGNSGHNTGISIHDLTIDGDCNYENGGCSSQPNPSEAGIVFHGIDKSTIYNVTVQDFSYSGVDLRDGSNNTVHDCISNDVAMNGSGTSGHHAFGGGAQQGLFQNNSFYNNQATGGGPYGGDHYDINGDISNTAANCTGNQIYNNTSTNAPTVGIYIDSCRSGSVSTNLITAPGTSGISTSGGVQWATGNTFTGNTVNNAGVSGITLGGNSESDSVTSNYFNNSGVQGILITDSGSHTIYANTITNPGQYGIVCTYANANCSNNSISSNTISSTSVTSTMIYGIQFFKPNTTGFLWNNTVTNNTTTGGQAGSTGLGINVPAGTKSTEVNVLTNYWSK